MVLGLLVVLGALVFVVLPLFQLSGSPERAVQGAGPHDEWLRRRDEAYAAIKEMEFDYEMGKLSPEDYRLMRSRYEGQAIEALAALDGAGADRPESGTAAGGKRRCVRCGDPVRRGRFCGSCGVPLSQGGA